MAVVETYIKPEGLHLVEEKRQRDAEARVGKASTSLALRSTPKEVPPHVAKLAELGFNTQVAWHNEGAAHEWGATTLYPELTGREFKAWRLFLPTTYTDLATYNHDVIPEEAVDAIHQATMFGCFERIEIWTDEANTARSVLQRGVAAEREAIQAAAARQRERMRNWDPMAVGILVGHDGRERPFAIVRWGKEKLMTLKQVERHNGTLSLRGHGLTLAPVAALGAVVAFLVSSGNALPGLTIPVMLALVIATVAANIIWRVGLAQYHKVLTPVIIKPSGRVIVNGEPIRVSRSDILVTGNRN